MSSHAFHGGRMLRTTIVLVAILLMTITLTGWAEDATAPPGEKPISVEQWLLLGPVASPFPAFNEGASKVTAGDLLEFNHISLKGLKPVPGATVSLAGAPPTAWKKITADTSGVSVAIDQKIPHIIYLAAYIDVPRWTKIKLEAKSNAVFDVMVDGSSIMQQKKAGKFDDASGKKSDTAKLETGKHLILVKGVYLPGDTLKDWRFALTVSAEKDFPVTPVVSLSPARVMQIGDVLDVPVIQSVDVSPDGQFVLLGISERTPPEGTSERWLEIRRIKDGALLRTIKDSDAAQWRWAPTGNRLSYALTKDDKATVRVLDLVTNISETIIEDIGDFSSYSWSPDGGYIVYSTNIHPKKDDTGIKRLRSIADRRHYERDQSYLYLAPVPAGISRSLTAGEYGAYLYDIHPDSRHILVGRSYEDLSERPYSRTELVLINIEDQTSEILFKGHWLNGAQWSPDGSKILMTGGPSLFGTAGQNVPEGVIPNDYDGQAYLFDPATKTAEALTRDFDPAVESVFWPKPGGDIYLVTEEGEFGELYRYNIKKKTFTKIDLECDVIHERDVARNTPVAVVTGSGANQPWRAYSVDLKKGRATPLLDTTAERYKDIEIGRIEDWNFTASNGTEIVGRIHYPPHFDASRKWPCIVYYYGGTSPVNRSFGGRYPKNLWAAAGYVVYVLQPSGATGFGQEFSAAHVNDWGKTTADEIIEGTGKFLEAHPFVDPARVGCIGASYGGFMTQLLVTKTDIFAAAISHAGISSIMSYWGEGYWGYEYNAVSAANSFPWNRPDIYQDQSPLLFADKVTTPLLLLHGASDTNVPPGESEQMYTALKLLGKEVEYIKFAGQDHFILDYKKRIAWSNAILGWFDKWLKAEPAWWNDMYPPLVQGIAAKPGALGIHRVNLERYGAVLLGQVTKKDIDRELPGWSAEYTAYVPDTAVVSALRKELSGITITCVLGTWCGDSKREVPRLWKILDALEFPAGDATWLAVGSSRFTLGMPIPREAFDWSAAIKTWYKVESVATIIVSRNGEELGRIVETPAQTLEADLLQIITK